MCEVFKKRFGPGSDYADAYERRNMSKHPENKGDFKGPVEGPWLQHAMRVVLENLDNGGVEGLGKVRKGYGCTRFCRKGKYLLAHLYTSLATHRLETKLNSV